MISLPTRPVFLVAAAVGAFALFATPLPATTWYVPSQCPTIQAGIDSAAAGDTVVVACGTYYEHSISLKSGLYLASETLQADCVTIDPNQTGSRVFWCADVDNTTWVVGFTITGTDVGDWGGGMYLRNSAPNLTECMFINNSASSGGGVYCEDSSPSFTHCRFEENAASLYGGGLHADADSDPQLIRCEFIENSAQSSGGGLAATDLTMTSCLFTGNSAQSFGGGAFASSVCFASSCSFSENTAGSGGGLSSVLCTVSDCSFATNSAGGHGGGVYSTSCSASDCFFLENAAGLNGGAIRCADASLERCIIAGNSARDGGGVYCLGRMFSSWQYCCITANWADGKGGGVSLEGDASPTLTHCTISANRASFLGGGFHCALYSFLELENSIVWGNCSPYAPQIYTHEELHITCSDIEGGWPGAGNINEDPLFCVPINCAQAPSSAGTWMLAAGSPCLPSGNGCGVQMGAYGYGCEVPTSASHGYQILSWSWIKSRYR